MFKLINSEYLGSNVGFEASKAVDPWLLTCTPLLQC